MLGQVLLATGVQVPGQRTEPVQGPLFVPRVMPSLERAPRR